MTWVIYNQFLLNSNEQIYYIHHYFFKDIKISNFDEDDNI